jgi:hypothetical protein
MSKQLEQTLQHRLEKPKNASGCRTNKYPRHSITLAPTGM